MDKGTGYDTCRVSPPLSTSMLPQIQQITGMFVMRTGGYAMMGTRTCESFDLPTEQ